MIRSFIISQAGLESVEPREFPAQSYEPDPYLKNSVLGTPIWCNLKFPAGTYQTLEGDVITFDGIEIDQVLLTVSMSKNVVTTAVVGRNGTVKEYIADGDYQVTIQGALASGQADVYPVTEFANLNEILKAPVSIKVESEFLAQFDIQELVVTGYEFPQVPGFRDLQYFSISAISDEPIELRQV